MIIQNRVDLSYENGLKNLATFKDGIIFRSIPGRQHLQLRSASTRSNFFLTLSVKSPLNRKQTRALFTKVNHFYWAECTRIIRKLWPP